MLQQLKTLLPYLRQHRIAYALGFAAIIASLTLRLWIPRVVGEAFNTLREDDPRDLDQRVLALIVTIVVAALLGGVTRNASRVAILGACRKIAHEIRTVLFEHLLVLPPSFYIRNPTGQIMSRCVNDLQNVQGLMGPVVLYLVETSVLYIIGIGLMLTLSVELTLIGLLPFPFFLFAARKLAVKIQNGSRAAQNCLGEVSAKIDESLSGQLVIKTLTLEEFDFGRFRDHCKSYRGLNLGVTRQRSILMPMMMSLPAISTLTLLALGGPQIVRGELALGDLVALLLYLRMFAGPTRTLGFVISSLRRGASALERISEILESEVSLVDPAEPKVFSSQEGSCAVEVRGLTIDYLPLSQQPHLSGSLAEEFAPQNETDEGRRVLNDICFKLPAGSTLGIVGHTGAGKTTLVRAIARMLEVPKGTVFLEGQDVTSLRLAEVRKRVGFVPQEVFLFSATLAENIALGRAEATPKEIQHAAELSQLAVDLEQLPEGLETLVGERGVRLSGGQRQRTALARVLLLSPQLLILDDTLSAVDTGTADKILEAIKPFAGARTTIIAAHRLSTLQDADHIIVLDSGWVAEEGNHEQLLAAGGIYADLWRRQERTARFETSTERLRHEFEDEVTP